MLPHTMEAPAAECQDEFGSVLGHMMTRMAYAEENHKVYARENACCRFLGEAKQGK